MNIYEKTHELNLDPNEYVVVAGGVLVALGLLEWDEDIDLTVSPEVFDRFRQEGWQQEDWKGKPVLKHDVFDVGVGFDDWSLRDLQDDAFHVDGIPFMGLKKLLTWKVRMGREKDLRHIALLETYIAGIEEDA